MKRSVSYTPNDWAFGVEAYWLKGHRVGLAVMFGPWSAAVSWGRR